MINGQPTAPASAGVNENVSRQVVRTMHRAFS